MSTYYISKIVNYLYKLKRIGNESEYLWEKWQKSLFEELYKIFNIGTQLEVSYYLDIGTRGNAYSVIGMARKGVRSLGINLSESDIKDAVNNARSFDILKDFNRVTFSVSDARALPFKCGIFKYISCIATLEHIPDYCSVIREISRVMEKNGVLFVLVPNTYKLMPYITRWHYRWIDREWGDHIHYEINSLINMFKDIGRFDLLDFGYRGHLVKVLQEFLNLLLPNNRWTSKVWWQLERRDKLLQYNPHAVHIWMAFVKR